MEASRTDVTSLHSLLVLLAYYLNVVPNFATIVEPLHSLLREGVSFQWGNEQEGAFASVKLDTQLHSPHSFRYDAAYPHHNSCLSLRITHGSAMHTSRRNKNHLIRIANTL